MFLRGFYGVPEGLLKGALQAGFLEGFLKGILEGVLGGSLGLLSLPTEIVFAGSGQGGLDGYSVFFYIVYYFSPP